MSKPTNLWEIQNCMFFNVGYYCFVKVEQYVNYAMKRTRYIPMGWWWWSRFL